MLLYMSSGRGDREVILEGGLQPIYLLHTVRLEEGSTFAHFRGLILRIFFYGGGGRRGIGRPFPRTAE